MDGEVEVVMAAPQHICNYDFGILVNFHAVLRFFYVFLRGFAVFGPPYAQLIKVGLQPEGTHNRHS